MNFSEAVDTATRLRVGQAYLTHLSHELDVFEASKELPDHFQFAYDGLKLQFSIES